MSVEDVIRVAQLKLRDARLARVTREAQARARRHRRHHRIHEARPRGGPRPAAAAARALGARARAARPLLAAQGAHHAVLGLLAPEAAGGPQILAPAHAALCRGGGVDRALARRWWSARSPSIRRRRARWLRPRRWCAAMPTPTSAASPTGRRIMEAVVEPGLSGCPAARAVCRRGAAGPAGGGEGPRGRGAWQTPSPRSTRSRMAATWQGWLRANRAFSRCPAGLPAA